MREDDDRRRARSPRFDDDEPRRRTRSSRNWSFKFAGLSIIVLGVLWWQCQDETGLSDAQIQRINCGVMLGEWEVLIVTGGAGTNSGGLIVSGGIAKFSLDDKGRVIGEDVQEVGEGRAICNQSGKTINLSYESDRSFGRDFELTTPDEIRQIGGSGTHLMFRRVKPFCLFS